MLYEEGNRLSCPLNYTLSLLNGKWKPYIIWHLGAQEAPVSYEELRQIIPYTISHKVFSQQLKELVSDGLIARISADEHGFNDVVDGLYELTKAGRSLCGILYMLSDWGYVHGDFDRSEPFHPQGRRVGGKILYSAETPQHLSEGAEFFVWMWERNADIDGMDKPAVTGAPSA